MRSASILVGLLLFTGCHASDTQTAELERQKLMLETLRTQQDTLAKIQQEEKKLQEHQKQHQDNLQRIEEEKTRLQQREEQQKERLAEITRRENEVRALTAKQKQELEQLKDAKKTLEKREELAKHRRPFLENLAQRTAHEIIKRHNETMEKWYNFYPDGETKRGIWPELCAAREHILSDNWHVKHWYDEKIRGLSIPVPLFDTDVLPLVRMCCSVLVESDVLVIESDEEFERRANEEMTRLRERLFSAAWDVQQLIKEGTQPRFHNEMKLPWKVPKGLGEHLKQQLPVQLSAGVALPQTGAEGTLMSFSVDYQFAGGQPPTSPDCVWVIERAGGPPLRQAAKLGAKNTLMALVPGWRPEDGPFSTHLEDRNGSRLSHSLPLK